MAPGFRILTNDALGRLVTVNESGSYTTTYTYNLLDNLTGVNQGGQTRSFTYTSLGRLASATNPESGTISYLYDNAGNLVKKTDARGVITCFGTLSGSTCTSSSFVGYNQRNEPIQKRYSDGTPSTTYCYDGQTWSGTTGSCSGTRVAPAYGRLTQAGSIISSQQYKNAYSYDTLGRIAGSTQTTAGQSYSFAYNYKLNDALSKITYPSGRIVENGFNGAGQVTGVAKGLVSGGVYYANSIVYEPFGALKSMTFPTAISRTEERAYDSRLRPSRIEVLGGMLRLDLGYFANGNLQSQTITRPSVFSTVTYGYDGVNRLTSAGQTGTTPWSHAYSYDAFGNRWQTAPSPTTVETPTVGAYNTSNNRVAAWTYDAAGNVRGIPAVGGSTTRASCASSILTGQAALRTSCYDAENRQTSATNVNGVTGTYVYDGEGRRVQSTVTGVTTTFVYDAAGQLAAEYGGTTPTETGTRYFAQDHLGSTRLTFKQDGTEDKRYDYFPFGQEVSSGVPLAYPQVAGSNSVKFTSKERDAETGLDYFGVRYMSSAQGRFTSPDPLMESADPAFPQTWNRYAYGLNNPLRFIDPSGMEAISVEDCQKNPDCVSVKLNVVYDQNAQIFDQKGNVLPEYRKKVDEQIARAKDEYGNALISFDVSFGMGAIGTKGEVTGIAKDALNVVVTDSRDTFVPGKSGESGGFAVTFLNAGRSDSRTLAHEIAHHFSGDTQGSRNFFMNVWADVRNDLDRLTLRTTTPIVGPYFGSEHRANRVTAPFNSGARRYFGSR